MWKRKIRTFRSRHLSAVTLTDLLENVLSKNERGELCQAQFQYSYYDL